MGHQGAVVFTLTRIQHVKVAGFANFQTAQRAFQIRQVIAEVKSHKTQTNKFALSILDGVVLRHILFAKLSVITQFDGLMFTLRDGQGGKDLQQNGTGIATGAVLAMSD